MKKKLLLVTVFAVIAIISSGIAAFASENITVNTNTMNIVVDGERVFADNFVYSDTTYVPLRRIAEMFGKKVEWDQSTNSALITDNESSEITDDTKSGLNEEKGKIITVDKNTMNIFVNGNKVDADNFVYQNTTYVPLRRIAEMLQKEVNWDRISNTASIGKPGISIYDGNVLGTINGIEFTDYIYDYYAMIYSEEFEYYEAVGENPQEILGASAEEYINDKLAFDYTLISYALENGMYMSPVYNASYYDSVNSTLKGVNGDQEKFQRMLEMQGFTSLHSYYYAMLVSDLFVQYSKPYEEFVTEAEIEEYYNNNEQLMMEYDLTSVSENIKRIIAQNKATEEINIKAEKAVIIKN